jgi:hypothetical protein
MRINRDVSCLGVDGAVPKSDPGSGVSRDSRTWSQDPDQIQRVGGAHADSCPLSNLASSSAENVDRIGQSVLLAKDGADETSTSHEAARLATAERTKDVSPWHREALPLVEASKDDSVPSQKLFGDLVRQELVMDEPLGVRRWQESPPTVDRSFATPSSGSHQVSQGLEPVGGHEAASHDVPERAGEFGTAEPRGESEILEEEGAALVERFERRHRLARARRLDVGFPSNGLK